MNFKDIEEAVLVALNITSKLKDPELTTAIQSILDKCVAYREEQNLEAPGVLHDDEEDLLETDNWKQSPYYSKAAQQINGWHSDADVRNLARQLRDADKKPTDDEVAPAFDLTTGKPEKEQSNDYPDPLDVGGLIHNSTAKKRNVIMRDWLEHNFNNDGFGLPKALFNRIHDSVNKLTGVNKDPEDEAAFIDALNKEFKNDFVSDKDHFGEGQAEGLDNLLEGLRDTPHDNRW